jgi:hypothetical protein
MISIVAHVNALNQIPHARYQKSSMTYQLVDVNVQFNKIHVVNLI